MPGSRRDKPLPVRRIELARGAALDPTRWPASLPAVAQLLRDGLDLGAVTVLVGEVGSGKSTIVEAVAMAFGLSPEGGSTGARHSTEPSESPLHEDLLLVRGAGASKWGYFVRAETMHGLFTYLQRNPSQSSYAVPDPDFHRLSHGQSFGALLSTRRFRQPGLFVLDEPEAGLSFGAQLELVAQLGDMATRPGTQLLVATHSPLVASLALRASSARILELDEWGFRQRPWAELTMVEHYRRYLADPQRYLRHLID